MTTFEIIFIAIIIAFLSYITYKVFQKDKIVPSEGQGTEIISEPDKPHGPAEPNQEV